MLLHFNFFPSTLVLSHHTVIIVAVLNSPCTKDDSPSGFCSTTCGALLHACWSNYIPISAFFFSPLPPPFFCLAITPANLESRHHFFPAVLVLRVCRCFDRQVIAPEADAWTRDDIALRHELILKLGRISGIHP